MLLLSDGHPKQNPMGPSHISRSAGEVMHATSYNSVHHRVFVHLEYHCSNGTKLTSDLSG